MKCSLHFSLVQLLSCVQLFVTQRTTACQASLSITNSQSWLELMSIESVMPSRHLILCRPLLLLPSIFPRIRVFSSEFFTSGGQRIGVSASASVLPMNIQDWFPLRLTGWISLQSKGLSSLLQHHSSKALCLVSHIIQVGPQYILIGWPNSGGTFCFPHWGHSLEDKVSFHLLDEVSPKVVFLPSWL